MLENSEQHYLKMTRTPVSRLIISLGIPTTISMLITNIYNLADTYFVGGLGASAQGATGILFTLQSIIQAIAFLLGHGSGSFVAKALADRNQKQASTYVSTAFFVGAGVGTLLSLGGLLFLDPFMRLLGSTETILPYARDYGMWVLIACPFMVCSLVLNNNLRYEGKAFYAMIGLTAGGILNIFGDWLLIRVFPLGVYGAGLATAVSQIISFLLLLFFYLRKAQSKLSLRYISRRAFVYLDVAKVGFPSLLRQGLTSISNGVLNNLLNPFGDDAIAAMSVVNRYSSFVMCVGLGIGQGYQPVASFNERVKEYDRVKKGLLFTTALGFCMVGLLALFGGIFAAPLFAIFQKSQSVIDIGIPALRYASVGLCFLPLFVPVNMLYQSIRKAAIASFLSLLRSGAVFLPVLLLASRFGGLTGLQMAQPIADVLTALITLPFFFLYLKKTPSTAQAKANLSCEKE